MSGRRGVLAFVVLLAVLGAGVLFVAIAVRGPLEAPVPVVLTFDVPSELEESEPPLQPFSLSGFHSGRPTLYDVVHGLRHAAHDDHVRALVLHVEDVEWGWAKLAEVRDAILEFRKQEKPVYATLDGGGEAEYLLASAADQVCAPPTGVLQLDGLTASAIFYRGTYDKVGIHPNFEHVGSFKSAVERYTRTDMSPASREALGAMLDDQYGLLVDSLAAARGLTPDSMRTLIDGGPYGASEARAFGLVDSLLYPSEVDSLARRSHDRSLQTLSFARYLDCLPEFHVGPRVALIVASGTIAGGRSRANPYEGRIIGAESLTEALRQARVRHNVKSVVLRIDSPGGDARAADQIWREVRRLQAQKPVIVSMSDYAASGGYYIAVAGERILAQPGTLTGSIGVFAGKFNVLGLLQKLGLNVETLARGRHAEMLSPYRDFTPEETEIFSRHLEEFYRVFLSRVAGGRRMTPAAVDSVGEGRVWSGLAAQRLGLIDRFGGLAEALEIARIRGQIARGDEVPVEQFPKPVHPLLARLLGDLFGNDDADTGGALALPPELQAWLAAARFPVGGALALMPYRIEFR